METDMEPRQRRAVRLILDFDGTITQKDTTAVLGRIAAARGDWNGREARTRAWDGVVAEYIADLTEHGLKWERSGSADGGGGGGSGGGVRSIEEEILYQRGLRDVEGRSLARVRDCGLMKGMERREWREGAVVMAADGVVSLRKGFREAVGMIEDQEALGGRWGVVSVNWSESWVRGVVDVALEKADVEVEVLCNVVDGASGEIRGPNATKHIPITTSLDKLNAMRSLLERWSAATAQPSQPPLTVYIGDSLTDLECLLDADVGIIMVDEGKVSKAKDLLVKNGVAVDHVSRYQELESKSRWWARDFVEVVESGVLRSYGG